MFFPISSMLLVPDIFRHIQSLTLATYGTNPTEAEWIGCGVIMWVKILDCLLPVT